MFRTASITLLAMTLTLCGCGNKSGGVPKSGLVLMAPPAHWETLVGTEVQVIGNVSRAKTPTIHGIEIDADPELAGKRATATGIVDAYIIEAPAANDPPAASRGPGVYYRLINPRDNKTAVAQPLSDEQ